ncbi:MAG: hypothetical protein AAFU85_13920 [Planctomycetota bacterium]
MNHQLTLRLVVVAFLATVATSASVFAHHPDSRNLEVRQRVDLVGPIGNRLPPGHRRKYNRPNRWAGWVAYRIAPSSQEAMSWHRAKHNGAYEKPKNAKRIEYHYFYPKPWEVLRIGARSSVTQGRESTPANTDYMPSPLTIEDETIIEELAPTPPSVTSDESGEELALPPVPKG